MPEKTKPEEKNSRETRKRKEQSAENDEGAWSRDQREKSYYYDDAYGYEIYQPGEDDDDE